MRHVTGWRRECPDAVRRLQEVAVLGAGTLFLLHQLGPTSYVIAEHRRKVPVKVSTRTPV